MLTKREAKAAGKSAGENAASWAFDGNTDDQTYADVVGMIDEGDPELESTIQEPEWLSGQWAGESMTELLGLDGDEDPDDVDEIANIYTDAASTAFWFTLERDARRAAKSRGLKGRGLRERRHSRFRGNGSGASRVMGSTTPRVRSR